ncbi:uncharacterized protein LOC108916347 [Anoplophora glabripennis]|nr:uncharacterized protein LOC108916347 [Anoplophora glabripennis]
MLKSLFPWKHHKTKAMAAQQTMDNEVADVEFQSQELLPCHVCGRTFLPSPLKKHERICEKTSTKKRKPFDSLKQRVEGTDLADFHQKTYLKRPEPSPSPDLKKKSQSTWKEKHLALVSAIRAAKGIPSDVSHALPKTKSTTMAGTERCPSCDRQFGPKAYDRHVEWCKEKKAQQRIHHSPANVLLAKERLEARTKYVPPLNRSKKTIVREKYSNHASTETLISVKTSSPLSRGPSVRKPRSAIDMGKNNEKCNNNSEERKPKFDKNGTGGGDKVKTHDGGDRCVPVIGSPSSRSEILKRGNFNYNPFESAQRQFMELLECDDFKELAPTCTPVKHTQRPHTSDVTPTKRPSPAANKKTIKSAEPVLTKVSKKANRASVIEPPSSFKDSLDSIADDFELMENLINDNFTDDNKNDTNGFYLHLKSEKESLTLSDILNSRKYSDDMSTIDPMLINENDNLSIPEHFKIDDYSPTSTADTDITIRNDIDCYSVQYDNKIAAFEPKVEKKSVKTKTEKKPAVKRSVSLVNRAKTDDSPLKATNKKLTNKTKLTSKSVSSITSAKTVTGDKKKGLSGLKRSMTLFDPSPKPPSLKNKNDVNNYFSEQEQKISMSIERNSPVKDLSDLLDETLKPEDLFNVDDEMYEEYKKYEEMYLKEKAQNSATKKHKPKIVDINLGIHTASEEEDHPPQFNKISNDSAYGSLTRKTPKHRSRATKLTPLEQKQADSTSSSGSENCPNSPAPANQRLSKFCHECGNKYPLTTAKFCVECGVKRLVL